MFCDEEPERRSACHISWFSVFPGPGWSQRCGRHSPPPWLCPLLPTAASRGPAGICVHRGEGDADELCSAATSPAPAAWLSPAGILVRKGEEGRARAGGGGGKRPFRRWHSGSFKGQTLERFKSAFKKREVTLVEHRRTKRETNTKRWTRDFFSTRSGFSWAEAELTPEAHTDSGGAALGSCFWFPWAPQEEPRKGPDV